MQQLEYTSTKKAFRRRAGITLHSHDALSVPSALQMRAATTRAHLSMQAILVELLAAKRKQGEDRMTKSRASTWEKSTQNAENQPNGAPTTPCTLAHAQVTRKTTEIAGE